MGYFKLINDVIPSEVGISVTCWTTWHQAIENTALGPLLANTSRRPSGPVLLGPFPGAPHACPPFLPGCLDPPPRSCTAVLTAPGGFLGSAEGGLVFTYSFLTRRGLSLGTRSPRFIYSVRLRVSDDGLTADGLVRVCVLGHRRGL